ncbi:MAG: sugar ABC transporter permease [Anaerolineaceae bacterium]|nr:MAG: sugar ABC transporter permease [Anaerolineaceae bacterium]
MMNWIKKRPYLLFLTPGIILYSIFVIYPIFAAANISLYKWNGIGKRVFVGINNYIELFTNQDLFNQMTNALKNSFLIFALTVIFVIPIQIIMAYIIYSKARGKSFFQAAIFSPQFIATPIIVFIFTLIFDGNIGLFNKLLEVAGFGHLAKPWLGIPKMGIYIVWGMISWAGVGVGMIYFLGAMKMIAFEEMESAYLEGAGFWKRLFYIVLPNIKMTALNLVLISYIIGMTIFDYSYILGGISGGIKGSVDVMSLFFYRMAFGDSNPLGGVISDNSIGMGTTIACVLFFMVFIVSMVQILIVYRKEEE